MHEASQAARRHDPRDEGSRLAEGSSFPLHADFHVPQRGHENLGEGAPGRPVCGARLHPSRGASKGQTASQDRHFLRAVPHQQYALPPARSAPGPGLARAFREVAPDDRHPRLLRVLLFQTKPARVLRRREPQGPSQNSQPRQRAYLLRIRQRPRQSRRSRHRRQPQRAGISAR